MDDPLTTFRRPADDRRQETLRRRLDRRRRQAKKAKGAGKGGKAASHGLIDPHYANARILSLRLDEAVDHHRAGRLIEAEEIYQRILAIEPDCPHALCPLGIIAGPPGRICRRASAAKTSLSAGQKLPGERPFLP